MDRTVALTWSWLNVLNAKRAEALRRVYGDLEKALQSIDEEMLRSLGCRQETIYKTLNRLEEFDPAAYERELKSRSLRFLTIEDPAYPAKLREIGDPPLFLYERGDLSILEQPCIALVGTREMSPYGRRAVEHFVPALVQAGTVTVSGLALGIDAAVAEETLRAGGKTVAVLGNGLASVFPASNARLADKIVAGGGVILSEFPLDTSPDKFTFPARNRIIAGLSLGTVVLEAGEGSGALITADLALDYGREVFAVPGQIFDPNYAGSHQLLSRGVAKLVSAPADILIELKIVVPEEGAVVYEPQNAEEAALCKVLSTMPQTVDMLVERSGLLAAGVSATLTVLELNGAVKHCGGGAWVRCSPAGK
ncbi:MAG: DNA-processing protein DprA [Candidatus Peribacteraceae bacterium]|nr:DNA-processing protein DprA [Candidatus Peribacteraceae bacterium]